MSRSWYDRHVLPWLIDAACGMGDIERQRRTIVPRARGRVLEVGIGTGRNLAHYDRSRVGRIVGLDPGVEMHHLARRRAAHHHLDVELLALSAEKIPLPDASFDSVLVTYSLCSIPEPVAALREMRRVLAPGGTLLYCEHGLSPDEDVQRWQHRIEPWWSKIAGGCHLARDIPALLREAGYRIEALDTGYLRGPRFVTFNYRGWARPA